MIIMSGLGVPEEFLKAGTHFNCTSTYCYGIRMDTTSPIWDVGEDLIDLQKQINRFASVAGFKVIATDGKIGNNTLAAAKALANYFISKGAAGTTAQVIQTVAGLTSFTNLTELALKFRTEIKTTANALQLSTEAPAVLVADTKPSSDGAGAGTVQPGAGGDAAGGSSNLWWWILGAAALVGATTVGVMVYKRRQRTGYNLPAYARA